VATGGLIGAVLGGIAVAFLLVISHVGEELNHD
jgi:hypothetical protein